MREYKMNKEHHFWFLPHHHPTQLTSSAVRHLGSVTGRGTTIGSKCRLQLGKRLKCGISTDTIVIFDGDGLLLAILVSHLCGDWNNFLIEPSILPSSSSTLV